MSPRESTLNHNNIQITPNLHRFFMYVDLESGNLEYGTKNGYWGAVSLESSALDEKKLRSLHTMIACGSNLTVGETLTDTVVQVDYRGSVLPGQ